MNLCRMYCFSPITNVQLLIANILPKYLLKLTSFYHWIYKFLNFWFYTEKKMLILQQILYFILKIWKLINLKFYWFSFSIFWWRENPMKVYKLHILYLYQIILISLKNYFQITLIGGILFLSIVITLLNSI